MSLISSGEAITDEALLKDVRDKMESCGMESSLQVATLRLLMDPPPEPRMTRVAPIVARLFPEERSAIVAAKQRTEDPSEWTAAIHERLMRHDALVIPSYLSYYITQGIVVDYIIGELNDQESYNEWSAKGALA